VARGESESEIVMMRHSGWRGGPLLITIISYSTTFSQVSTLALIH
jgi:hypothetical protein